MKNIRTFEEFLNESTSLSYWTQYKDGGDGSSPTWMDREVKTMSDVISLIDRCIDEWNSEAESADQISKSSEKHIGDLAIRYFSRFNSINGHIIDAMIMQEA